MAYNTLYKQNDIEKSVIGVVVNNADGAVKVTKELKPNLILMDIVLKG